MSIPFIAVCKLDRSAGAVLIAVDGFIRINSVRL
jgi:hypothetical protein